MESVINFTVFYVAFGLFVGVCAAETMDGGRIRGYFWWAKYWLMVATVWPMFLFLWSGRR